MLGTLGTHVLIKQFKIDVLYKVSHSLSLSFCNWSMLEEYNYDETIVRTT
jgi:hypothetical protein